MDYSQHGEQQIITDYFKGFNGILLDIGANDGITFSNSRALIEQGWGGCLVEPSEFSFAQLVKNSNAYPKTFCRNVAIGTYNGEADFYESGTLLGGEDHSLVSSLKEQETQRWKTINAPGQKIVDYQKTKVKVVDWKTFLKSSPYTQFDFITMDIEGMELEVLGQMNLIELGCKMICVEYNNKNSEKFDSLIPFPLLYKNRTNLIYAKHS